jgi:hypothetical protein
MRNPTLIFALIVSASMPVWAGQSIEKTLVTKAAGDAVKSATPAALTEGAKTVGKANALKKTVQNPSAADKEPVQGKAGEATATDAAPSGTAAKEGAGKAATAKESASTPSTLVNKASDSAKSKAKAKAADSALEMLH